MNDSTAFDAWAIVELFGHQRIAGRVTEQVIAGQGFVRVDVPETPRGLAFSRLYGPNAIYSILPTSEEIARAFMVRNVVQPVQMYELAPLKQLEPPIDAFNQPDRFPGEDESEGDPEGHWPDTDPGF